MTACRRSSETVAHIVTRATCCDNVNVPEVIGVCRWSQVMRDTSFDRSSATRLHTQRAVRAWVRRHKVAPTAAEQTIINKLPH